MKEIRGFDNGQEKEIFINKSLYSSHKDKKRGVKMDDDFEIVPKGKIERLKKEIDALKEKKGVNLNSLKISIDELNETLNNLMFALKHAKEDMENDPFVKDIKDKLDTILNQNHKIAEGILAIAELITKDKEKSSLPSFESKGFQEKVPMSGPAPLEQHPLNPKSPSPPPFPPPNISPPNVPPPNFTAPPGAFPSPGPMPRDDLGPKRKFLRK